MKSVVIIRNSRKGDVGGAEKYPIIAGGILSDHGFKVFLMSSNKKTMAMADSAGLDTITSPWWSFQNFSGVGLVLFPLYIIWQIYLLVWYLFSFRKLRADIIYPQSRDDFIAASIAGIILRKKVIWTDHADLKNIYMNNHLWYKNPVGKIVFYVSNLVDRVTVESNSEKKLIEKALKRKLPKNYEVLYIGVVDKYVKSYTDKSDIVLISTSRLVKDKGIAEMILAFSKVNNKRAVLKICGEGPDEKIFKNMAKDQPNIEFLGFIDNVQDVLSEADILIHPTYHEGFGLSLVEAEMCKLPVIASKVGSIPEIVQDGINGILVPVKNVEKLAEAMSLLINNKKLREDMGVNGRKIFLSRFQLDQIIKEKLIPLIEQ